MVVGLLTKFARTAEMVKPGRDFAVGDLVLIADERVHRGQWPLGRVLKVHPEGMDLSDQSRLPQSCLYRQGQF